MKNFTGNTLTSSAVRTRMPACWQLVMSAARTQAQAQGHTPEAALVRGEKSALFALKQTQISGGAMNLSAYGFGNPVHVDATRVRVAAGVPPRSRPV